jgi:hypothetical protein
MARRGANSKEMVEKEQETFYAMAGEVTTWCQHGRRVPTYISPNIQVPNVQLRCR